MTTVRSNKREKLVQITSLHKHTLCTCGAPPACGYTHRHQMQCATVMIALCVLNNLQLSAISTVSPIHLHEPICTCMHDLCVSPSPSLHSSCCSTASPHSQDNSRQPCCCASPGAAEHRAAVPLQLLLVNSWLPEAYRHNSHRSDLHNRHLRQLLIQQHAQTQYLLLSYYYCWQALLLTVPSPMSHCCACKCSYCHCGTKHSQRHACGLYSAQLLLQLLRLACCQ